MACNPLNQKLAVKNPPTFCGNSPNLRNSQAHYIGGFLTKASEAPGAFSNGKIPGMSGMSRFEKAEDQRRAEAKDILTLRIWCQFILKFRTLVPTPLPAEKKKLRLLETSLNLWAAGPRWLWAIRAFPDFSLTSLAWPSHMLRIWGLFSF